MPDIMMCDDLLCKKAARCYRHAASGTKPDQYAQTFWLRDADSPRDDDCPQFWERTPLVAAFHDDSMP